MLGAKVSGLDFAPGASGFAACMVLRIYDV